MSIAKAINSHKIDFFLYLLIIKYYFNQNLEYVLQSQELHPDPR